MVPLRRDRRYSPHITIRDIPDEAWDYVVSGKPALQWVMERQCVKTDKASGIVRDANRYALETLGATRDLHAPRVN